MPLLLLWGSDKHETSFPLLGLIGQQTETMVGACWERGKAPGRSEKECRHDGLSPAHCFAGCVQGDWLAVQDFQDIGGQCNIEQSKSFLKAALILQKQAEAHPISQ